MIPRRKLVDRSVHVRDARIYVLVVEGDETEPAYFNALQARDLIPRHRVILHIIPPEEHKSAPRYLISNAEKAKAQHQLLRDDEIWLVFDVDRQSGSDRLQQVIEAGRDASAEGWSVAISNPCFELWLLLHIHDDGDALSEITEKGQSAEIKIQKLLGSYNKCRTPAACLTLDALQRAVERARARDVDPASPLPALRASRVYRLIERMRSTQAA